MISHKVLCKERAGIVQIASPNCFESSPSKVLIFCWACGDNSVTTRQPLSLAPMFVAGMVRIMQLLYQKTFRTELVEAEILCRVLYVGGAEGMFSNCG